MNFMNNFVKSRLLTVSVATCLLSAGCSTFRPMPTHGGGKRFDEEQRVVAASIRHVAGRMDLAQLPKSKIAIEVTSIPSSGGAEEVNYFGLEQIYAYNLKPKLLTKKNLTRQDLQYLEKSLEARLRFDGYQVTSPADADLYLVVLVDVLGTNHRRFDFGIAYRDHLGASCEVTYYVIDAKTQKMISSAKSVASFGDYCELNVRFTPLSFHSSRVMRFYDTTVVLPDMINHSFATKRGDASVAMLQLQAPAEEGKKKKRKGKGKERSRRRGPKLNLPHDPMENGPDDELLPPMDEVAPPLDKDAKRQKVKDLTKTVRKSLKKGNLDAAQAALDEIKALSPKAKVIEKFAPQIEAARKAAPAEPAQEAPAVEAPNAVPPIEIPDPVKEPAPALVPDVIPPAEKPLKPVEDPQPPQAAPAPEKTPAVPEPAAKMIHDFPWDRQEKVPFNEFKPPFLLPDPSGELVEDELLVRREVCVLSADS